METIIPILEDRSLVVRVEANTQSTFTALELSRDKIAERLRFWPLWKMKFRFKSEDGTVIKDYDASDGVDWWLPRLEQRIYQWNVEAGNPSQDSNHRNYAYHVRIR